MIINHCLLCRRPLRKGSDFGESCKELILKRIPSLHKKDGSVSVKRFKKLKRCFNCMFFKPIFLRKQKKLAQEQLDNSDSFPGFCTLTHNHKCVDGFDKGCIFFINRFKPDSIHINYHNANDNSVHYQYVKSVPNSSTPLLLTSNNNDSSSSEDDNHLLELLDL